MNPEVLGEVLSSKPRVEIVDALSTRPRTLGELSWITGISVQGVLRHLKRLTELGIVEERKVRAKTPKARKVYAAKSGAIGDYSTAGLTVVKATEIMPEDTNASAKGRDVEAMASDILILRRRVRDQARKLGRMIDDLSDGQVSLRRVLEGLPVDEKTKLILEVLLTEETVEDGEKVLARFYGLGDRRSIDKALAQAKRIVGTQETGHGNKR